MQGTVATFEPDHTGTVFLDDGTKVSFSAEVFAASGLRLLRLGQRVQLTTGTDQAVNSLRIPTMP